MSAQSTIQKLRESLAEEREVNRKLSVVVKALREANPELARLVDERDMMAKALEIYQEEVAHLNTAAGAIAKAIANPGTEVTFDEYGTRVTRAAPGSSVAIGGGPALPVGAGTWTPSLTVEKAREQDEAREVRRAADRLVRDGRTEILKARAAREARDRKEPL